MENITNESLTQLLSAKFEVEPYQMLVLLEAIENKYQIKISQEDIENRKFNSYADILQIINKENERKEGSKNGN